VIVGQGQHTGGARSGHFGRCGDLTNWIEEQNPLSPGLAQCRDDQICPRPETRTHDGQLTRAGVMADYLILTHRVGRE
jgi:hypothetical protein